jgi:hypothetical protein
MKSPKARVIFVGRDHRSIARNKGKIILTVQPVIGRDELQSHIPGLRVRSEELLLCKSSFEVRETDIRHPYDVEMDWSWDGKLMGRHYSGFFIRQEVDLEEKTWWSIRYAHSTRADIEVIHYGRDHLISFAADSEDVKPLSLPLVLFIDDFGVFRSMTRSAKAFHITPASLPYWERRKPGNNFVLTIAPHKADLDNVISNLEEEMTALADGMNIPINGGEGGAIHVKAFPLILTGDMPQQSDNAGFLRHNATLGCRCCKIPSNDRADLDYDIVANERYHFDTVFLRQEGSFLDGNERKEFFKSHGMSPKASPIARIAPTLDIILSIGLDEPHVLWRGIGRLLYILVITHVLDGLGRVHFIREFQRFRFPPGWQRIQSPLHQKKWTLSESGRAAIVLPLVLRCCGDEAWYDMRILRAFRELGLSHHLLEGCDSEVHGIIKLLSYLAIAISATGSFITKLTPSDVNQLIRRAADIDSIERRRRRAMQPRPACLLQSPF